MSPPQRAPAAAGSIKAHVLTLLALFAWLAATAWMRPLAIPDEARYVGVAWEMVWSGNWLVPSLDTLPYFHKPPLFYWMTAAALSLFGANEWAARLASLLAATGCAFALFVFLRRWTSDGQARTALLVLASTPFFVGAAQFANLDMLVAACISCTILCAADAVLSLQEGRPYRLALLAAYIFAALGILAKGLIGAVIPGIVIVGWLLYLARPRMLLRLVWLPGLLSFGVIVVPWFALMQAKYPGFVDYFFVYQHFLRYASKGFNEPRQVWFYVPVFAGLTLPWSVVLVVAVVRRQVGMRPTRPEIGALMWIWLAATLVFFSIPTSKLVGYVLPAVPPLAVLAGHALSALRETDASQYLWARRSGIVAAILCLAAAPVVTLRDRNNISHLANEIRPRMGPADRLLAVQAYPFSAPFYLRHRQPIPIVDAWDAPWVPMKDNWRKELYDAGKFDPARGSAILVRPEGLAGALCSERTVWIFGPELRVAHPPELDALERVAQNAKGAVWRSPPSRRFCRD